MNLGDKNKNRILKDKNTIINKFMYFSTKTLILTGILILIWIVVFIFIIWPNIVGDASDLGKAQIHYMQVMNIGTIVNLIIIVLVGVLAKLFYRNRKVKCRKCNAVNRADKWYCGNCGERLLDDDCIKPLSSRAGKK